MFNFKRLQENDIKLLMQWFSHPHVAQWWPDERKLSELEVRAKYMPRANLQHAVKAFIVYLDEQPIGYIQYYEVTKIGEAFWEQEAAGTFGIDQFIGDPDAIGKGYGTQLIKEFIALFLCNPEVKKIVVLVDPENGRAIRCYEKVGFKKIRLINKLGCSEILMELNVNKGYI